MPELIVGMLMDADQRLSILLDMARMKFADGLEPPPAAAPFEIPNFFYPRPSKHHARDDEQRRSGNI